MWRREKKKGGGRGKKSKEGEEVDGRRKIQDPEKVSLWGPCCENPKLKTQSLGPVSMSPEIRRLDEPRGSQVCPIHLLGRDGGWAPAQGAHRFPGLDARARQGKRRGAWRLLE